MWKKSCKKDWLAGRIGPTVKLSTFGGHWRRPENPSGRKLRKSSQPRILFFHDDPQRAGVRRRSDLLIGKPDMRLTS
jgi:hypothetical protein